LPKVLRGYGKTPGIDAVVVVLDTDKRDCAAFLTELKAAAAACNPAPDTLFRLAIEEIEAWYFGDQAALLAAYPRAKMDVLGRIRSRQRIWYVGAARRRSACWRIGSNQESWLAITGTSEA
jgi:hypothetical protein